MIPVPHPLLGPAMPGALMSPASVTVQNPTETLLVQCPTSGTPTDAADGPAPATDIPSRAAWAVHREESAHNVVTVVAGHERIELDIEENVLRKVPFFNAILDAQGQSIHKSIDMPDEHPDVVCALLEYIYQGNYSCNVDYQREKYRQDAVNLGITASETCLEKVFHLQVFLLAEKIGYRELGCFSCNCTRYRALGAIEKLLFWKIWYSTTERLGDAPKVFASQGAPAVREWIHEILENFPNAIKSVVRDVPALAFELLRSAFLCLLD